MHLIYQKLACELPIESIKTDDLHLKYLYFFFLRRLEELSTIGSLQSYLLVGCQEVGLH